MDFGAIGMFYSAVCVQHYSILIRLEAPAGLYIFRDGNPHMVITAEL